MPIHLTGGKSSHCGSLIESTLSLANGHNVELPSRNNSTLSLHWKNILKNQN